MLNRSNKLTFSWFPAAILVVSQRILLRTVRNPAPPWMIDKSCFFLNKSWDIYLFTTYFHLSLSTGARFPLSSYLHSHRRSHQVWFPLEEPYRSLPRPTTFMNPGLPPLKYVSWSSWWRERPGPIWCFIAFYRIKKVMDIINFSPL